MTAVDALAWWGAGLSTILGFIRVHDWRLDRPRLALRCEEVVRELPIEITRDGPKGLTDTAEVTVGSRVVVTNLSRRPASLRTVGITFREGRDRTQPVSEAVVLAEQDSHAVNFGGLEVPDGIRYLWAVDGNGKRHRSEEWPGWG